MDNNQLTHWGVKGMKWGVRRYQTKNGALTPAGRKRYNKDMEKLKAQEKVLKNKQRTKAMIDKLEEKRRSIKEQNDELAGKTTKKPKQESETEAPTTKPSSKPKTLDLDSLSDAELNTIVNRLNNEKRYRELNPEQVSKGKKFVKDMVEKAVVPALQEVAKEQLKKGINSAINNASAKK